MLKPTIRSAARRAKKLAGPLATLLVLGVAGCDCGDGMMMMPDGPCMDACTAAIAPATGGTICCESTDMCVPYDFAALCDPGYLCSGPAALVLDDGCGVTCSDCVRQPALMEGTLATHLDMDVADDGTVVLSGYSPGIIGGRKYGDLVIGTYDSASMTATWDIVDGAPDSPVTNDPEGYRGGVSAPGDDVGRWTSIAEAGGTYYVSYYDRTNGALKLAVGTPGGGFNVSTVDDVGDSGRYSSIAIDGAGHPVIAYLQMVAAEDASGQVLSTARVAATTSAAPAGPTDWASTEIASAAMLCRPGLCAMGTTCLESGLCATDTGDCAAACASGEMCFMGNCEAELGDGYVEDMPPALGMYNSLVATSSGLALVFYDRTTGNLWGSSNDGATWASPFLIDGYGTESLGVGDSGIGASLFVDDAGTWHVTYVDGAEETLRYASVEGTTVTREVVDNGATDGTAPNPDGRHIVGDDSNVVVTSAGEIRVVYQDATSQRAMLARRPASGGEWAISIIDAENSTGYWMEQQLVGTTSFVGLYFTGRMGSGVRVLNVD